MPFSVGCALLESHRYRSQPYRHTEDQIGQKQRLFRPHVEIGYVSQKKLVNPKAFSISVSFILLMFISMWPISTLYIADMVHVAADVVCGRYSRPPC